MSEAMSSVAHDYLQMLEALDFWTSLYEVILYSILAVAIGLLALKRGRGGLAWFLIAFLTTPLLGLILLMLFPRSSDMQSVNDKALRASIRKGNTDV